MALFQAPKNTRAQNKQLIQKSKTQTVSKAVKAAGGIDGAVKQMIAHAETKLGKYKDEYIILQDINEIKSYLALCEEDIYCAIDTETTGLDVFTVDLVGICLYSENNKPAYIPLNHKSRVTGIHTQGQPDYDKVKQFIAGCTQIKWIMHNADYDVRILRHTMGLDLKCYWDTLIGAKMLDENQTTYSLKDLHIKFCNSKDSEALSFNTLFNGVTFDNIPITTAYLYAAGDALKTYELYKYQKAEFEKPGRENLYKVFLEIEMPIVDVVANMEDTGIAVDFEYSAKLIKKYNKIKVEAAHDAAIAISMYQAEIDRYRVRNPQCKLDNPINLGSPTQLAILFYDILGLKSPDKKSPRGTGEEILKHFAAGKERAICQAILEVRKVEKLLGTYIEKMPQLAQRDGRIHCRFNQLGARTGRFSSSEPNMQNIPSHNKDIRQMFKASPGYKLISGDYSKQEVFIAASVSEDKYFIESCKKALKNNTDLYSEIASMIYNLPYDDCVEFRKDGTTNSQGKERRGNAKAIVLGILYSKEVPSIASDLNITREKAQQIYDKVLAAFPALRKFMQQSQKDAREKGYVETAWGRRRHLPDMQLDDYEFTSDEVVDFDPLSFSKIAVNTGVPKKLKDSYTKRMKAAFGWAKKNAVISEAKERGIKIKDNTGLIQQATRQCVNSRVQGSAGDITKVAMILVDKDTELQSLGFRLLLTIHDELMAEVPEQNVERACERMTELMVKAGAERITVPMKVDMEITDNWYGK